MSRPQAEFEKPNDLSEALKQTKKFQRAILKLACSPEILKGPLLTASRLVTTLVASETEVDRVSLWMLNSTGTELDCVDLHETKARKHTSGQKLIRSEYPKYFEALDSGRTIVANSAVENPQTCEFAHSYLVPLGITSMLDAAVRIDGRVRGILCLEHTGAERDWSPQEIAFCAEAADQVAFAILSDERGRLRAQYEQAQRIESLGLLVGGIAHDFNNLLMVILGNLELVQTSPFGQNEIQDAKAATLRASELVRKLLAFGQEQVLQREALSLGDVVEGMLPFLKRIISKNIEVSINRASESDFIAADRLQIEQVIMNLAINARDSIEECTDSRQGRIHFNVEDDPLLDSTIVLSIEDNGLGIPEELRDRVFEPFFTTKTREVGSGLGLAVIHGIVSQHEGTVEFESHGGQGVVFHLKFGKTNERPIKETGD